MVPYKPPAFRVSAFNCPICNAYSNQLWQETHYVKSSGYYTPFSSLMRAECSHCGKFSLWLNGQMIYPEDSGVPLPNPDLSKDIIEDYNEARSILNKSPRGGAALLRLAIQKLCNQLGEKGDLDASIANLVKKGLTIKIQQALDIVRVIGNNAVHPGQIDLKDNRDTALQLFNLINIIANVMISEPKEVEKLYQSLPKGAKDAIERRDR